MGRVQSNNIFPWQQISRVRREIREGKSLLFKKKTREITLISYYELGIPFFRYILFKTGTYFCLPADKKPQTAL